MEKTDFDKQKRNVKAALGIIDTVLNGEVSREDKRQCEKKKKKKIQQTNMNSFFLIFVLFSRSHS